MLARRAAEGKRLLSWGREKASTLFIALVCIVGVIWLGVNVLSLQGSAKENRKPSDRSIASCALNLLLFLLACCCCYRCHSSPQQDDEDFFKSEQVFDSPRQRIDTPQQREGEGEGTMPTSEEEGRAPSCRG